MKHPTQLSVHALWVMVSLVPLIGLTGCGKDSAQNSGLDAVQDNLHVGFYENSFLVPEDEHPKIPGSTLYYMLMSDPATQESRAYAIDCRGQEESLTLVASAFGTDASSPFYSSDSYETLERDYKINEQPILRCANLFPGAGNKAISTVFRVIDDRPDDQKKDKAVPQVLMRFNNVTADDATSQEQLYSVGCYEIFSRFGSIVQQLPWISATPILASSAASIFPDFETNRPLNCMKNTSPANPLAFTDRIDFLPLTTTYDITQRQLEFYRVVDAVNPAKTVSYLVGRGKEYKRVLCPNVRDNEIKTALNFPSDYVTLDLNNDDSRYFNSLNGPALECVNMQTVGRFKNRWSTVREVPSVNFYEKKGAKTLYRFGCPSAESYFTSGLKLPSSPLQVTSAFMSYLEVTPAATIRL